MHGEKSKCVFYRPETFDVICYVQHPGELRVHAETIGEQNLYRREFGNLIAKNPDHFRSPEKYILDPLVRDGQRSLLCSGKDGIDHIVLRELQVRKSAIHFKYSIVYKESDVFAVLEDRSELLDTNDELVKATFLVTDAHLPSPSSLFQQCARRGIISELAVEHAVTEHR